MDPLPAPEHSTDGFHVLYGVVGMITGALVVLVPLVLKWIGGRSDIKQKDNKATLELQISQSKSQQDLELEAVERKSKVDMDVHSQVVQQMTNLLTSNEERFKTVVEQSRVERTQLIRQMEERETQFGIMIKESRDERDECIRKHARLEGQVESLRNQMKYLQQELVSYKQAKAFRKSDSDPNLKGPKQEPPA